MKLRLGFHYHISIYQREGRLNMPGYLGRFLDELANHFEYITCFAHSPRQDEIDKMDYSVKSSNIRLVNIGPHDSVTNRTLRQKWIARVIESEIDSLDVFFIKSPYSIAACHRTDLYRRARSIIISWRLCGRDR